VTNGVGVSSTACEYKAYAVHKNRHAKYQRKCIYVTGMYQNIKLSAVMFTPELIAGKMFCLLRNTLRKINILPVIVLV